MTSADWMDEAICTVMDPDMFFPGKGGTVAHIVATCQSCPVIEQCWQYAMGLPKWHTAHGVWAATTPLQRRAEIDAAAAEGRFPDRHRARLRKVYFRNGEEHLMHNDHVTGAA